jgi:hypothetical protein
MWRSPENTLCNHAFAENGDIDRLTNLIDCPTRVALLSVNLHKDFVDVVRVTVASIFVVSIDEFKRIGI